MKTKIKILFLSMILLLSSIPSALADFGDYIPDAEVYKSLITPNRPGLNFDTNQAGLDYASFNNFYNNPNLTSDYRGQDGATSHDERYFLLGKYCDGGVCLGEPEDSIGQDSLPEDNDAYYYNTLQINELKAGDEIEFMVYFHNNGKDPFKNPGADTYAEDVEISIDLDNIIDPSDSSILRPVASIYSEDNTYKDSAGNTLSSHTATDDMQIKRTNPYQHLEPVALTEDKGIDLIIPWGTGEGTADNAMLPDLYEEDSYIQFHYYEDGEEYDFLTTAHPKIEGNKISITFDKLPGCFRFSGFVFFRAKVVEDLPPVCTDLSFTEKGEEIDANGNVISSNYEALATFSDGVHPDEAKYLWTLSPVDGEVGHLEVNGVNRGTEVSLDKNAEVIQVGPGNLYVTVDPATYDPEFINDQCNAENTTNAPEYGVCTDLDMDAIKTEEIDGLPHHTYTAEAIFSDGIHPDTVMYTWTVEQYGDSPLGYFLVNGTNVGQSVNVPVNEEVTLVGYGRINVTVDPSTYEGSITDECSDSIGFVQREAICKEIDVEVNVPIEEGVISTFTAASVDTAGNEFEGQITYTVPEEYGYFMTEDCTTYEKSSHPVQLTELLKADVLNLTSAKKAAILKEIEIKKIEIPTRADLSDVQILTPDLEDIYVPDIEDYKENLEDILSCRSYTTLTVDPGETVYFYGEKSSDGENVITVSTEGTDVEDCEKQYPIQSAPEVPDLPRCIDATFTHEDSIINGQNGFKISVSPIFVPTYYSNDYELLPVSMLWETTDEDGVFYTLENGEYVVHTSPYSQSSTIVGRRIGQRHVFSDVYYVGNENIEETVTVSFDTKDANGNSYEVCDGSFPIEPIPEELVCENLTLFDFSSGSAENLYSIESGESYILSAVVDYSQNDYSGQTTYLIAEGGLIKAKDRIAADIAKRIADQILANGFTNADLAESSLPSEITVEDGEYVILLTTEDSEEGTGALLVKAEGRDEIDCATTLSLINELICIDLEVYDWTIASDPIVLHSVQANSFYELSTSVKYSKLEDGQTTYQSDYGVFITVNQGSTLTENVSLSTVRSIANSLIERDFDSNTSTSLPNEITVEDGQTVFFITYADAPSTDEGLRVYAEGRDEEDCEKVFPIIEAPIDEYCVDLTIVKPSGDWDDNDFTDDEEQKFEIEVETYPASYEDSLEYRWEVDPEDGGDWSEGEITDEKVNYLRDIDEREEPRVTVTAIDKDTGEEIPACRARKTYEFNDEPPEIEKYVYDVKGEDFENTINIGGKATDDEGNWINRWLDSDFRYVNYLIEFTPNSARSAQIWEKYLDNEVIEGSLDGELEYLDMAIVVEPYGSEDPYLIFKTDDFDEDRYLNEKIGSERIDDYDDFDEDLDDLEDKYLCEDADEDVVCIAEDFDDIEDLFKDGDKITFDNLENADKLYIIIQTENNTVITDDRCKELETTDGCGELFNNTIHFEGTRDHLDSDFDLEDDEYDGDDSAEVIVLCPYIITREGGDVFFKDILDTGVDVQYCSEVDNTEIIITTPDKPDEVIPSTGDDGSEQIIYQVPTHDICKLSNTEEGQLEEYRNVLKNFSSSICEMEAEVSENWTEENITSQVSANIERLSRFGKLERDITVLSQADLNLQGFSNIESGVFVIEEGSLTIGDGTNDYMINSAQTYIVKGGDLIIESNIKYDDSVVDPLKPESFPSSAFIVIDGNIKISNTVNQIDGVLMAVNTEDNDNGQIMALQSLPTYDETLLVNGSMIGDVYDIFFKRRAIGNLLEDEGSITVKYDQRILLNTPPGLGELIDLNQLKIAN